MSYDLVEGDTGVKLRVVCTEKDGEITRFIDLTGCTAVVRWTGTASVVERDLLITNADSGMVEYTFGPNEVVAPEMEFEVIVTDAFGNIRASLQTFRKRVRERLA